MQPIKNKAPYFINQGQQRGQVIKAFSQGEDQIHRLRSPFLYYRGYIFPLIAVVFLCLQWWIAAGVVLLLYFGLGYFIYRQHKQNREMMEDQMSQLKSQFPDLWKQYRRAKDSKPKPEGKINELKARALSAINDYKAAYARRKARKAEK